MLTRRLRQREVFVPLRHDPGHAQVDFGEALAVIGGVERKIHFFAMDLPHSDAGFVQAYPAETTEAFCAGHNAAFGFFGGCRSSILYDNTKLAVARILGDGTRQRTRVFSELQSHYLFADRFGRPGKGNDKGKVEGLVGWIRRNFLVPMPRAASFAALNEQLLDGLPPPARRSAARSRRDDRRTAGAGSGGVPLPAGDALRRLREEDGPGQLAVAGALSRHRLLGADRLRPPRGSDPRLRRRGGDLLRRRDHRPARPRSYEREDFVFDPLHYLALLEQKIGALDQAAPLVGWDLPEEFATLRRLLEARMGKRGKREFVQVLRLLEIFRLDDVLAGVKEAIARGAIGFDAVKHLVLCRIERRPPRLDLTVYPYLPRATVATTSARTYMDLLTGAAS